MKTPLETLVRLDDDRLGESLVWIDWRSFESEVIESFSDELGDGDAFAYEDEDAPRQVTWRGETYEIPLLESGRDRYVVICSLARILAGHYEVFADADSYHGADTHGFLILSSDEARTARARHSDWLQARFEDLRLGRDGFSGQAIPYTGGPAPIACEEREAKKPFWKFW